MHRQMFDDNEVINESNLKLALKSFRLNCGQDAIPESFPSFQTWAKTQHCNQQHSSGKSSKHSLEKKELLTFLQTVQDDTTMDEDEHADIYCVCGKNDVGQATLQEYQPEEEPMTDKQIENVESQSEHSSTDRGPVKTEEVETAPEIVMPKNTIKPFVAKKKRKKNNHVTQRVKQSFDKVVNDKKPTKIFQAVYPGVHCGHKNCIHYPVVTPKTMGWLWSLSETGGVKINRNWRPGAISKNVAIIMDEVRNGSKVKADITDMADMADVAERTMKETVKRQKPRPTSPTDLRKVNVEKLESIQLHDQHEGEPVLAINKKERRYGIKMNPVSFMDKDGQRVRPENLEPVHIKLQKKRSATAESSQSNMNIKLIQLN